MFDTIILLTGPVEEAALTQALRTHNPQLAVHAAKSLAQLETIDRHVLRRARLVGFVTPVIVPARILNALGFGAYNFHPGPPSYPGWVPSHFAVYDGAIEFGATAHVMVEKVDAGPIVGVERFAVPPRTRVAELELLAFVRLARLFWRLAPALATQSEPLPVLPVAWSGCKSTRHGYAAMCEISPEITQDELERRVEAFGTGQFGIDLTVMLHGHKFRYVPPSAATGAPDIAPAQQNFEAA